jgi:MSHA biogenesis protein MshM
LILDEAQALADEVLEECRLLGNVETATGERLAIVLVSQPELAARLRQPHFAALKQRVGARCVLRALTVQETGAYVAARVRLAGGDAGPLFSREAIRAIYESSGGIPRTINVLCHNALLAIFGAGQPRVEFDTVADVCAGLDLPVPSRPQPAMAFSAAPGQKAPSRVRLALRFPRRTVEQAVR